MSFYRRLIVAVAAMGLATSVFAADENTTSTTSTTEATTAAAPADTSATPAADTTKTTDTTTDSTTTTTSDKLNLNTATAKELMKVKGLNAAKAKAIVTYRKQHGDFKAVEDLKEVKGFKKMNDTRMQKIEDQLTIG